MVLRVKCRRTDDDRADVVAGSNAGNRLPRHSGHNVPASGHLSEASPSGDAGDVTRSRDRPDAAGGAQGKARRIARPTGAADDRNAEVVTARRRRVVAGPAQPRLEIRPAIAPADV